MFENEKRKSFAMNDTKLSARCFCKLELIDPYFRKLGIYWNLKTEAFDKSFHNLKKVIVFI